MPLHYPLQLRFKLLAIASQIEVRDATGTMLLYVKQKAFKLREAVTVFSDERQQAALYRVAADRIIDWSAQYTITTTGGGPIGVIRRQGMRSLWRARYEISDASGAPRFGVHEASVMVRILDALLGDIPVLGLLTGYLFHPSYLVTDLATGQEVLKVQKQPALFEGRFRVEQLAPVDDTGEELVLLGILMMLLLERVRG